MSEQIEHPAPIPPRLRASVDRHEANLASLVASLRQAGMDEQTIEASLGTIVESYRAELVDVIKSLAARPWAAEPEAPATRGPP